MTIRKSATITLGLHREKRTAPLHTFKAFLLRKTNQSNIRLTTYVEYAFLNFYTTNIVFLSSDLIFPISIAS